MHLRRDVCLWHVADKKCHYERKQGYPTGTQYPAGTLSMKLQENKKRQGCPAVFLLVVKGENLMDFWGSLRVQKILVYLRTRIFGFRKNAEKAQIIAFYTRDMYSPVRVSTLIVSPWFTKKGTWMI